MIQSELYRNIQINKRYAQYPNAIRKRKLFPKHLGISWNKVGVENIEKRMHHKAMSGSSEISSDEKRMHKGLSDTYKLALNSGLN